MTAKYVVTDEHLLAIIRRFHELQGRILKGGVDPDITLGHLQLAIENVSLIPRVVDQIKSWEWFYKKRDLGLGFDLSQIQIPKQRPGFNRLIIMAVNRETMVERFISDYRRSHKLTDQLKNLILTMFDLGGVHREVPYAIWTRGGVEVDEKYVGKSASSVLKAGVLTMSAFEYLMFRAKYYDEFGENLDVDRKTICAGSITTDNKAPYFGYNQAEETLIAGSCVLANVTKDRGYREIIAA
jgi:hypothetical protein